MIIGDYTVIFWIIGDMINEMDSYILGIFIVCYGGFTINQPASWNDKGLLNTTQLFWNMLTLRYPAKLPLCFLFKKVSESKKNSFQ